MTRPAIGGISPFFIVADMAATLAFYRDGLGFDVTILVESPDDPCGGARSARRHVLRAGRRHA
jgi:catechol 2,3-dioxygenase-like lactoylglutathione lyase family enzyme